MNIELEQGKHYRITLKDGTSFRFRFKGNIPNNGKLLCQRLDETSNEFDVNELGEFKTIEECE
jgi:hypothetical protein